MIKTIKDQTSYIKKLEKKFDCLTIWVKKREKQAEVAIKKMESMINRLMALVATHPKSSLITRNNLSNFQVLQSICPRDERIDRPEKAELQKKLIRDPYLIVDLDKCELAQKKLLYLEIRNSLQASLKA